MVLQQHPALPSMHRDAAPLPAMLSVAATSVHEAAGAVLEFKVMPAGTAPGTVSMDYATQDRVDDEATSGTLTCSPRQTSKPVRVTVLDEHDDAQNEALRSHAIPGRPSGSIRGPISKPSAG